jgi:phosphatidylinositol glycan class Z
MGALVHSSFGVEIWKHLFIRVDHSRLLLLIYDRYIHPDEFFQSIEVASKDIFGWKTLIPWEFAPEDPCRSITVV